MGHMTCVSYLFIQLYFNIHDAHNLIATKTYSSNLSRSRRGLNATRRPPRHPHPQDKLQIDGDSSHVDVLLQWWLVLLEGSSCDRPSSLVQALSCKYVFSAY
ncbi:hypothetical protein L1987_36994 [Smallanthus sonchifolius]|uniref:Uncharacterized protein n=1 Tax=Smallanthus sonchifolius TaxID=185202 RepID=A0ACB9HER3_9ASTR|nr:hypothetical protein L1987_36994 [Smallanthus sonchifolius]